MGGTTSNLDYFVAASYLHNHGIDNTTASPDPLHDLTDQEKLFGYFSHRFDQTQPADLASERFLRGLSNSRHGGTAPIYQLANSPPANSAAANNNQNEQNYYAVLSYQKSAGNFLSQVSVLTRYTDIRFTPDPVQGLLLGGNAAQVKTAISPTAFRWTRLTSGRSPHPPRRDACHL